MKNLSTLEKVLLGLSIAVFALFFGARFIDIEKFLPYYSIDENDVVEFAVGYLGGNWDPHWYKYGALYSYLLAFIYKIQALSFDGTMDEFAQQIFFEPKGFYYTARLFNSILSTGLVVLTFMIGKKFFSSRMALIALLIACFPFFEILVKFTTRVDTLLAVFGVAAVYFSFSYYKSGKLVHYIIAGLMVGFGIATKPIPGLLVLPTMAIAHYFRCQAVLEEKKLKSDFISVGSKFLSDKNIYILIAAVFVANFIGNPYSILNFDGFMNEQVSAIGSEGARNYKKGYDITRYFKNYGYVFVLITCFAFLHSFINHRTKKFILLMSYPIIFWLAFAKGAARGYFYVPIIPFLILVVAKLIDDVAEKVKDKKGLDIALPVIIVFAIIFQPAKQLLASSTEMNSKSNYKDVHTALSANDWVIENIPKGSKVMLYGYYTALPHLIDNNLQEQQFYGEHFMYNRNQNEYLVAQFAEAHKKRVASDKPTYDLITQLNFKYQKQDIRWNLRYGVRKNEINLFQQILPQVGCDYLIATEYDRKSKTFNLPNSPYFQSKVVKKFSSKDYPFGKEITVYKLK